MTKSKRIIVVALFMTLIFTTFAACGGRNLSETQNGIYPSEDGAHDYISIAMRGNSMYPTFENDTSLTIRSMSDYVPQRGSIIAFNLENFLDELLVRRVIAVAGETIDIIDGAVIVNGIVIDEPYIGSEPMLTIGLTTAFPVTMPDGYFFVMGDNRNNSIDSRHEEIGIVHKSNIVGIIQGGADSE